MNKKVNAQTILSLSKLLLFTIFTMVAVHLRAQKVEDFIEAAKQGNSSAQAKLGTIYAREENWSQASYWFEKAARNGNSKAQMKLGTLYSLGLGVEKDMATAIYWITESANRGYDVAQYDLGWEYSHGEIVEKDYSKAVFWYQKAAEQKFPLAFNNLAYLYADGKGVTKSFSKAHEMIDIALSLEPNDPQFLDAKGEIYLKEGNMEKAKEIWDQMKKKYPKKIEDSVNDPNDVFCATMMKMESEMQNGIDTGIPVTSISASNTFAFIIANESYKRVAHVPFAKNDGQIFAEYCKKTLGIPTNNVKVWIDATLADMRYVITKIKQVAEAYDGDANIILYYAGHGIPSDDQQNSYLLPIDGYSADASSLSLHELYRALSNLNTKSTLVFLDACFSGSQRNGEMFASTRGVAIKPKQENPEGNLIVFSAAQGDETALPYEDMNHGLFSYFLLKKLQECKGNCTIGELADYVTTNVKRTSISIGDKMQTPKVSASSTMGDWRNIRLK